MERQSLWTHQDEEVELDDASITTSKGWTNRQQNGRQKPLASLCTKTMPLPLLLLSPTLCNNRTGSVVPTTDISPLSALIDSSNSKSPKSIYTCSSLQDSDSLTCTEGIQQNDDHSEAGRNRTSLQLLELLDLELLELESAFLPSFSLTTTTPLLSGINNNNNHNKSLLFSHSINNNNHIPCANTTPTLSLSFRSISIDILHSTYKSLNVQLQLALMLSVPWRGMSTSAVTQATGTGSSIPAGLAAHLGSSASHFVGRQHNYYYNHNHPSLRANNLVVSALGLGIALGVATFSCVGCLGIARLILPHARCFVVFSRQALANAIAAGQRLVALVLVVKEPPPPTSIPRTPRTQTVQSPITDTGSTRASGSRSERLLLTPNNNPKQHERNIVTPSYHTADKQSAQTSPYQSPCRLRRLPRDSRRGISSASLRIITKSPDLAREIYEYSPPLTMINESGWPIMDSSSPSSIDGLLHTLRSHPPTSNSFSPVWNSPRRQSTFSTTATIVPQNSPPRALRASPLRDRSTSAAPLPSKRFSLSFPVQPSCPSRPPSWHTNTNLSAEILASPLEGNFLTVLAHQERRVMELRDELRTAENKLTMLKKQWASMESSKSQQQHTSSIVQQSPRAKALSSLEGTNTDSNDNGFWIQREMDRRKNFTGPGPRHPGRKVFSGSRHTRTLSLLSPNKGTNSQELPPSNPRTKIAGAKARAPLSALERPTPPLFSDATSALPLPKDLFYSELTSIPKDAILKTGKQMIGDIREGMWTFFEDIRQATVGDEAIHGTSNRPIDSTPTTSSTTQSSHKTVHERRLARHNTTHVKPQPRAAAYSMAYDSHLDGVQGVFRRENALGIEIDKENNNAAPLIDAEAMGNLDCTTIKSIRCNGQSTPLKPRDIEDNWDTWSTPAKSASSAASPIPALVHIKSPSESTYSISNSTLETQDVSDPSSPSQTLTPHTLTPASASYDKNMLEITHASNRSKRTSGIWVDHLAQIAPIGVEQLKKTANQILADWERGVAANSPSGCDHQVSSP